MKADNEPAISLPAYFKRSVKIEICFSIKKKKERKKNQVSDGGNRTPDFFFSLEERGWARIPNYEYMDEELQ